MSSSEIAITVKNLSKRYAIFGNPRDRLKQMILPRLQRLIGLKPKHYFDEFWALRDISFEIEKGATVGIVGPNGSGKSTLLQLVCGTLSPSEGSIEINGRVAALLELGSGLNPEFTGRENIYMYASVLGLSVETIDEQYSKIIAFADIGDFIEQPMKTYSSGMVLRLAFAVIAHVEADILVIDEALAVGDAVFSQKCMRFLRRFMQTGTVLFVSHDINTVNNLCQQSIWLSHGSMKMFDATSDVAKAYMQYCNQKIYGESVTLDPLIVSKPVNKERNNNKRADTIVNFFEDIANSDGWKTGAAEIISVEIMYCDGRLISVATGGEEIQLKIRARINEALLSPIIGFLVKDKLGQSLFGENTFTCIQHPCAVDAGEILEANFVFNLPLLPNGDYSVTASIANGTPSDHTQHHWLHDAVLIHVQSTALRYGLVGIPFTNVSMSKTPC